MLVSENAQRCGIEQKVLRLPDRQSDPSRGEHASEVSVRKEGDIAIHHAELGEEALGALGNLHGRLSVWSTVPKKIPSRLGIENIGGKAPLVVAMVPFRQVRLDLGWRRELR